MRNINNRLLQTLLPLMSAALLLASAACGGDDDPTAVPAPAAATSVSGSITGRVTDAAGQSVEGARVAIVSGTAAFPEIAAITGPDGSYQLGSLSAGTYEVAAHNDDGDRIGQGSATVAASGAATLDIVSTEAAMVSSKPNKWDSPPAMTIDPNKTYTATIHLEKGGEIVIELYPKEAPVTVNSFVFLARQGYYDGVTFHRVIPGFMAQGGDPTGTGTSGPGYTFENEPSTLRRHDKPGVLSMANAGGLATNGSQFFITFVPTAALDGYNPDGSLKNCATRGVSCHTVFGNVIEGMDVVNGISERDPSSASSPGDAMRTITIDESG